MKSVLLLGLILSLALSQRGRDPLCQRWNRRGCAKCVRGANLNWKNKRCQRSSDPFCLKKGWNGVCVQCAQGTNPDLNGRCSTASIQCPQGYYIDSNKCTLSSDPPCLSLNNGVCNKCAEGSNPDLNGRCVQSLNSPCLRWNNGVCVQCARGTRPDLNGNCPKFIQNNSTILDNIIVTFY